MPWLKLRLRCLKYYTNCDAYSVCCAGSPPVVIARGGFSGIFPDSSLASYNLALKASSPNITLWCDLQLTKDGVGICFPDVKLDNATDISVVYPGKAKDYSVNMVPTRGWFSFDFNFKELQIVSRKSYFSRSNYKIVS